MAVEVVLTPSVTQTTDSRHPILSIAPRIGIYQPSSDDDTAVLQTLDAMTAIARRTAAEDAVQRAAQDAQRSLPAGSSRRDQAAAIWRWVKSHVRFVSDDTLYSGAREVLIEPPLLLAMPDPRGDCDDFVTLIMAMLTAAGLPARAIVIGADPAEPSRFSHVCAETVLEDGSTMTLDASHGPYAGWEAPRQFRRLPWLFVGAEPELQPDWALLALAAFAGAVVIWIAGRLEAR